MVIGPPLMIPAEIQRDQIETCRQQVENELQQLTDTAEQWAASGQTMDCQLPLLRSTSPYYRLSCRPPVDRAA